MISFVWPDFPFTPWAGGSETYTLGHLRELNGRGIDSRIVTYTPEVAESLKKHPEIPALHVPSIAALADLDDTLVFVLKQPPRVRTKRQAYIILHSSITSTVHDDSAFFNKYGISDIRAVAPSNYLAGHWKKHLNLNYMPDVVYPFVDDAFIGAKRPVRPKGARPRVLFAGRATPDKGIYTLLASLHMPPLDKLDFELTCIKAFNHRGPTKVINKVLEAHPLVNAIPPRTTRKDMAKLYTEHDVVVMPSSKMIWREGFGMVSVEGQHCGCRVVASNSGGLPETDCGSLIITEADNPVQLAQKIGDAIKLGPLTSAERSLVTGKYTVAQSIDQLLRVIDYPQEAGG